MSRHAARPFLPVLALLALILFIPTLATAFPESATLRLPAESSSTAPGLLARLWDFLSAVWTTGSILEPDGASGAAGPGDPDAGSTGDTGSGLEPNG